MPKARGERLRPSIGQGNMIAWLSTAWAKMLVTDCGLKVKTAEDATNVSGYPFEWLDELQGESDD